MQTCTSTGLLTTSTLVTSRPALLHGIVVVEAAAVAQLNVFDGLDSSGNEVIGTVVKTATTSGSVMMSCPIECDVGIYASVSGVGAKYIVYYSDM